MRLRPRLLLTLAVLSIAVGCAQPAARPAEKPKPTPSVDWSGSPRSEGFEYFRRLHDSADNWPSPFGGRRESFGRPTVAITWFLREGTALQYAVGANGREWDSRHVYNWAIRATHEKQLDAAQMRELSAALSSLPISTTTPPVENLVIVSRWVGETWRTDVYDSRKLPPPMESVMAIIGERFETRERRNAA
jgi:hypothetical protein